MKIELYNGNNIDVLKTFEDNSIDSIVTDPPYGLSFMNKKWDYDVPSVELWQECLRVLKPGGHLLAACGTRTQHRMATNIEDAGFEIRDLIAWIYGSGFPKSLNIGKQISKLQGEEREIIGKSNRHKGQSYQWGGDIRHQTHSENKCIITKGTSEFEGWGTALKPAMELWTMARKPISEKNIAENVLRWRTGGINIDGCRVAVDPNENSALVNRNRNTPEGYTYSTDKQDYDRCHFQKGVKTRNLKESLENAINLGRFPANLIHDGSEEVVAGFPETSSGLLNPAKHKIGKDGWNYNHGIYGERKAMTDNIEFGNDSGSASRFFYTAKAHSSERNYGLEGWLYNMEIVIYVCDLFENQYIIKDNKLWKDVNLTQEGKLASLLKDLDIYQIKVISVSGTQPKKDIDLNTLLFGKELTAKSQKDFKYIIKTAKNLITESKIWNLYLHSHIKENTQDAILKMETGLNLVESVEYLNQLQNIINEKMESVLGANNAVLKILLKINEKENRNIHSTVKPLDLMQYLVRLVTPKGGVCLDAFMGSGTTGMACKLEHFDFIGIELEPEYFNIAKARIDAVGEVTEVKLDNGKLF